jgi:aryl-alcohol dehydrogenase-like predicted oxidoreductase
MSGPLLTLGGAPVSRLGLGCSQMGSLANPATLKQSGDLVRLALDLGVNHFDTADIYGQGDSERAIGRGIRGRREDAFVITKFGKRFSPKMRLIRPLKPLLKPLLQARGATGAVVGRRDAAMREDFRPARLSAALDVSLKRLGLGQTDAVLLHSPPLAVLRDPATEQALAAILAAGKARYAGVSVETEAEMDAALDLPSAAILQIPLSLGELLARPAWAARLEGRFVFAREIIRLQPDAPPATAIARALGRPGLAGVILGTRTPAHLQEAARMRP